MSWRYDDDPTDVVKETVTIRAAKSSGAVGGSEPHDGCRCSGSRHWSMVSPLPADRMLITEGMAA